MLTLTLTPAVSDEANSKTAALRERNEKESVAHMAELKDLLRTLDHDHKLKEFMSTKAHERQILEDEEKIRKKGKISLIVGKISEYKKHSALLLKLWTGVIEKSLCWRWVA